MGVPMNVVVLDVGGQLKRSCEWMTRFSARSRRPATKFPSRTSVSTLLPRYTSIRSGTFSSHSRRSCYSFFFCVTTKETCPPAVASGDVSPCDIAADALGGIGDAGRRQHLVENRQALLGELKARRARAALGLPVGAGTNQLIETIERILGGAELPVEGAHGGERLLRRMRLRQHQSARLCRGGRTRGRVVRPCAGAVALPSPGTGRARDRRARRRALRRRSRCRA